MSRPLPAAVPVDRAWAWVVLLGSFGNMALVVGTLKSFGVLLVELSHKYHAPASLLVSSQSLCGWLHLGLAPFANYLSARFGHRRVVFCGGVLAAVGLVSSGFVSHIEWFFVTYGLLTGTGLGLVLGPTMVFPGLYFDKKLPMALGLSAAGSGFGAFVLPNLMRFLLDRYALSGCLLIMGGVMLHTCVFALLLRPRSYWGASLSISQVVIDIEHNFTENKMADQEERQELLTHQGRSTKAGGGATLTHQFILTRSLPSLIEPPRKTKITCSQSESNVFYPNLPFTSDLMQSNHFDQCESEKQKEVSQKELIMNIPLLRNPVFFLLCIGSFLGIFGHHIVFNFVPPLAEEFGFSDSQGALCVSIVGLLDFVGRGGGGVVGNMCFREMRNLYIMSVFLFSCCAVAIVFLRTFAVFIMTCGLLGLSTGGYIGSQLAMVAEELGRENLSRAWGYIAFVSSFSILINPVISGAIRDYCGSWMNSFTMAAVCGFVSASVLFSIPRIRKCLQRKRGL